MHKQGITAAARALRLGAYRSLSTSLAPHAATATVTPPSSSASSESTSSDSTPSSSAAAKRNYTRRTAVPASSARPGTAKSASTSAPISAAAIKGRSARVAPAKAVKVDADADAAASMDDAEIEAMAAEDHTMQSFSGIDDYAHLAHQPRTAPAAAAGQSASARAPRRAVPPRAATGNTFSSDQPTPSPPMTSLPTGTSTLPIIGGHAGMPTPATLLAAESAGTEVARQPDIPGEVSAPAGSDWSTSFYGLSQQPFSKEVAEALLKPLEPEDVELKPDGLLYLPEIKYRRTLNAAFGPGGWGLAPRGETNVGPRIVSREWGLVCMGRLVSVARGEQEYFDPSGIPTATEACKSNALMRCCKDLGIASELWDPRFIREYKAKYCEEVFTEHVAKKTKRKQWRKKGTKFEYPWKET